MCWGLKYHLAYEVHSVLLIYNQGLKLIKAAGPEKRGHDMC